VGIAHLTKLEGVSQVGWFYKLYTTESQSEFKK